MISAPDSWGEECHRDPANKIGEARARGHIAVTGHVLWCTATEHADTVACRVEIGDGSGRLGLLFFGRSAIPGLVAGAHVRVWGTAIPDGTGFVLWNPRYELVLSTVPGGDEPDGTPAA